VQERKLALAGAVDVTVRVVVDDDDDLVAVVTVAVRRRCEKMEKEAAD
jgi:hypothetical protein